MKLFLKEPTLSDKEEIVKMCDELRNCDDEYKFEGLNNFKDVTSENFEEFLTKLEENKYIEDINPNYANQTTFILTDENNHVYGAGNLRHSLKGNLINIGGHIGYAMRPSERGKGYGKKQLLLFLQKAKEMGIDKALLTCRENNMASARVIEKCCGEKDYSVPSMYEGIMESRYWIDINYVLDKEGEVYEGNEGKEFNKGI